MVFKRIERILLFGSGEDNLRFIGNIVEKLKAGGAWHFHVKEQKVYSVFVEKFERRCHVHEMSLHLKPATFLATSFQIIGRDFQVLYYYTIQFHEVNAVSLLYSSCKIVFAS